MKECKSYQACSANVNPLHRSRLLQLRVKCLIFGVLYFQVCKIPTRLAYEHASFVGCLVLIHRHLFAISLSHQIRRLHELASFTDVIRGKFWHTLRLCIHTLVASMSQTHYPHLRGRVLGSRLLNRLISFS